MGFLLLDAHRTRFRSDADFDAFVSAVEAAGEGEDATPVWANSRHLATLISRQLAKSLVRDRMLRRIMDNPELLDELKDRLENDEIVG